MPPLPPELVGAAAAGGLAACGAAFEDLAPEPVSEVDLLSFGADAEVAPAGGVAAFGELLTPEDPLLAGMEEVFTPGSRSSGGGACFGAGAGLCCARTAGVTRAGDRANSPTTIHRGVMSYTIILPL